MKRRVETKTLTRELWIVRRAAGAEPARLQRWCDACGGFVWMIPPEDAAAMAGVRARDVYRWVEAALLHFTETPGGALLVCLNSLPIKGGAL